MLIDRLFRRLFPKKAPAPPAAGLFHITRPAETVVGEVVRSLRDRHSMWELTDDGLCLNHRTARLQVTLPVEGDQCELYVGAKLYQITKAETAALSDTVSRWLAHYLQEHDSPLRQYLRNSFVEARTVLPTTPGSPVDNTTLESDNSTPTVDADSR